MCSSHTSQIDLQFISLRLFAVVLKLGLSICPTVQYHKTVLLTTVYI